MASVGNWLQNWLYGLSKYGQGPGGRFNVAAPFMAATPRGQQEATDEQSVLHGAAGEQLGQFGEQGAARKRRSDIIAEMARSPMRATNYPYPISSPEALTQSQGVTKTTGESMRDLAMLMAGTYGFPGVGGLETGQKGAEMLGLGSLIQPPGLTPEQIRAQALLKKLQEGGGGVGAANEGTAFPTAAPGTQSAPGGGMTPSMVIANLLKRVFNAQPGPNQELRKPVVRPTQPSLAPSPVGLGANSLMGLFSRGMTPQFAEPSGGPSTNLNSGDFSFPNGIPQAEMSREQLMQMIQALIQTLR